jgi:cellulose synthase/poly-beta-1,6-N-acetylglucosamine synthase-like glycosyltransferase
MKVSIITPTTGNSFLAECIESVRNQTYKEVEHIVVVDGRDRWENAKIVLDVCQFGSGHNEHLIILPYSTGIDRYNGHRIYGGTTYFAQGDYHIWLDDDNLLESNHVESLVNLTQEKDLDWAYSFRKIIDKGGNVVCLDDCESLGLWPSVLNPKDYFIDVNCYFVRKELATRISPIWYRKFRETNQPEVDRVIASTLMHANNKLKFDCTLDYTVKYRVGNTGLSVKADFFLNGNDIILARHSGNLPWKK